MIRDKRIKFTEKKKKKISIQLGTSILEFISNRRTKSTSRKFSRGVCKLADKTVIPLSSNFPVSDNTVLTPL